MPSDKSKKDGIAALTSVTKQTNARTYGIRSDIPSLLTKDVDLFAAALNNDRDNNKALINSHMTKSKLSKKALNSDSIYDMINNPDIINAMQETIGADNLQFAQTLKDYEIIKRCIPQIHRVITIIKTNILSPDSMASKNIVEVKVPSGTDKADDIAIHKILEKYEINKRLQNDIVQDYLIASVKYVTVVPYSMIPDMLHKDAEEGISINESIDRLRDKLDSNISSLNEAAGAFTINESATLLESADYYEKDDIDNDIYYNSQSAITNILNEQLNQIEFVNGGMSYFRDAILNEAYNIADSSKDNKAMNAVFKDLKSDSGVSHAKKFDDYATDGFIDEKTYKAIKNTVDFTGAHIEYLPASRTITFKLRDTIIGYLYVEDKLIGNKIREGNITSIMDKINSSVYMKNNDDRQAKAQNIKNGVIKTISEKIVKAINPKFLNDNKDDMDIIYEFVRSNELFCKPKRVIFFHPDDVCEFRRADGSIMKNCMFLAKLYILNLLSNIIAKVTRGSDRNIHYVKTGLTTDISGAVMDTIRAIKQNQIRYSDIGTINEIFNIVGSNVDVFMPISVDGERPIETETISGQDVDMNNDFLNSLIRSIIQSFGVPASMIEDLDSVDFAKTISMNNIEMAKLVFDAQMELNRPLTKLIRLLVKYELPEYENVENIDANLIPPSVIVYEMNKDRMDSIEQVATVLSELLVPIDGETDEQRRKRLFKLEYYRQNMSTWDWTKIDEIVTYSFARAKEVAKEEELYSEGSQNDNNY